MALQKRTGAPKESPSKRVRIKAPSTRRSRSIKLFCQNEFVTSEEQTKNGDTEQKCINGSDAKIRLGADGKDNSNKTRPELCGEPPIWADLRVELCETLPWFRCFQGGTYHHDGLVWGFLIDEEDDSQRCHVDDEIVITRCGGGYQRSADGTLKLRKSHDKESSALVSLRRNLELRVPIGLVIGDKNKSLGAKLPHRYNVMDWFLVTDIWYENVDNNVGARIRFQKLDLEKKSWWALKSSPEPHPLEQRDFNDPRILPCKLCEKLSAKVYKVGWMCLNLECEQFWKVNEQEPGLDLGGFHQGFLNSRTVHDNSILPHHDLKPDLLGTLGKEDEKNMTIRVMWRGIVCPLCNRCIPRLHWRGWKCSETEENSCPFEKWFAPSHISLRSIIDDVELSPIQRAVNPKGSILPIRSLIGNYVKLVYEIENVGYIVHFMVNRKELDRQNGPNELFRKLQEEELGLQRRSMHTGASTMYTSHFATNFGMKYTYAAEVGTIPFRKASSQLMHAMGRLRWATEHVVGMAGDTYLKPNELLMLGYFEGMKIGYHDDGEKNLGPTIATLSLGCRAQMSVRMKAKYFTGLSNNKCLVLDDPALTGCFNDEKRQEWKYKLEKGMISKEQYEERLGALLGAVKGRGTLDRNRSHREKVTPTARGGETSRKSAKGKSKEADPVLHLELQHGDLLVMHGANLQKYYEHKIEGNNKLRFALTARRITPESSDGEYELQPDQVYQGDQSVESGSCLNSRIGSNMRGPVGD